MQLNENRKTEIPCFICSHVYNKTKPILLVCKEDGDWQFLCGEDHDVEEIPKLVGLNHIIESDNTISEILNLKNNFEAERKVVGGKWKMRKSAH